MLFRPLTLTALASTALFSACGGGDSTSSSDAEGAGDDAVTLQTKSVHCTPTADNSRKVMGTGHSVFKNDAQGNPLPQPAQMRIWCADESGQWKSDVVDDSDSNVFHKIIPMPNGTLVTIGAMAAHLKEWTVTDGNWSGKTLWEKSWGGRFDRLRDIEIGDVDHDGKDEWAIATHDQGVVAVYNPDEGADAVIEMDQTADTFVHEIEIGDISAGASGGVVEEDVDAAELFDGAVNTGFDLVGVGYIAMGIGCASAGALEFLGELFAVLVIDVGADYRRAFFDEAPQSCGTDSAAATADPCHFAVELTHCYCSWKSRHLRR